MPRDTNIVDAQLLNSADEYIDLKQEYGDPVENKAYFVVDQSCYDGMASMGVADEQFPTDNTDFRMQFAKTQYAPREIVMTGLIITPGSKNNQLAYANRVKLLREIQHVLSRKGNLRLVLETAYPDDTYTWYCHLRGASAFQVRNFPEHYAVSVTLYGEDPLLYGVEREVSRVQGNTTRVVNNGDVAYSAKMVIATQQGSDLLALYRGDQQATTIYEKLVFLTPPTVPVTIDVQYPGQIISISGTTFENIDISQSTLFPRIPRGESFWFAKSTEGMFPAVTIYTRSPLVGISP